MCVQGRSGSRPGLWREERAGVWGHPLVLKSRALPMFGGGRGEFRAQRSPSRGERGRAGVLERELWEARGQAGSLLGSHLASGLSVEARIPGNRGQQCTLFWGGWPEPSPAPGGISGPGQRQYQQPGSPTCWSWASVGSVFLRANGLPSHKRLSSSRTGPGGKIIKSDPALQSCANCGISGALAGSLTKGPPWPCHPSQPPNPSSAHKAKRW